MLFVHVCLLVWFVRVVAYWRCFRASCTTIHLLSPISTRVFRAEMFYLLQISAGDSPPI